MGMIIAIDGPAGAGKSTVAKIVAKKLKFIYIDTGAMYRAITLKALDKPVAISNVADLVKMALNTKIDLISKRDGSLKILMDGKDVSKAIRHPRITKSVSDVAKIKQIRKIMLELQRRLGEKNNSVLEGRDIGTVVFPNAQKKFYLDARLDERAKRRYKELKESLIKNVTLLSVSADLTNRDTIDSSRKFAPLKKAEDAVYVDTTYLGIDEVVGKILSEVRNKK
ncbi:(d)CMP kinase [bacterium]|nr:MAG: (d)CMP kinase [bacterium]